MGIPRDLVERMIFSYRTMPDPNRVVEHMSGELEPWQKLLGEKRIRMTKKGREALEHYNKLLGLLNLGVPRVKKPELFGEEQLAAK